MEPSPPVKPPRGIKTSKESSGLLMTVIRTLSASETNEQRDKEKAKLEEEYKLSDRKLDKLISNHDADLTEVMKIFTLLSQQVSESKDKIHKVKENLKACKTLLHCRRDELKNLWQEGLEYKYMLEILNEIDKMNTIPSALAQHISKKQYLHATKLVVEASSGKTKLDGIEGLKELSQEITDKRDTLHIMILADLKQHLYWKPSQHVLTLQRQGSGREGFFNTQFRKSSESRMSGRTQAIAKKLIFDSNKTDNFDKIENLEVKDPEADSSYFMAILVKSLVLLDKLQLALNEIKSKMEIELLQVVQKTTYHIISLNNFQNNNSALLELFQILFEQFKQIGQVHSIFLEHLDKAVKVHNIEIIKFDINEFWMKVQNVLKNLLNDYLDVQNVSGGGIQPLTTDGNDISSYFSRRKQQGKRKTIFKFEGSSSALTMQSLKKSNEPMLNNKSLVCQPDINNIMIIFIPFFQFIEDVEHIMNLDHGKHCFLYDYLSSNVKDTFLPRKYQEILARIENAVSVSDAWKSTVLLDVTIDYKPILQSTVAVDNCIQEWRAVLNSLPLYSDLIVKYACDTLKEYRDICIAAYQGLVQPHSEDRRICSAGWLKDDDISRFLKSLPNWVNLKNQQECQARNERRRFIKRELTLEEESPEDVRQRNRKEAEILASNLGEGGVSAGEILSDMNILKDLAQLQESMEWFSVRMLKFASDIRCEPLTSPNLTNGSCVDISVPVSSTTSQKFTSVAQEFDELANTCLLLLHLEVRVQCFHYLLMQVEHNKETHEADPKVLELGRVLANVDEAVTSSLHARKCKYIFEGLGHLIAKILISSCQYLNVINESEIQRMCRNIFALQQTLTNITMTRELALDHARHYFELFFLTPDELLNGIVEKGPAFSELEYMNAIQLLHRSKANKKLGNIQDHMQRLSNILGEVGVQV